MFLEFFWAFSKHSTDWHINPKQIFLMKAFSMVMKQQQNKDRHSYFCLYLLFCSLGSINGENSLGLIIFLVPTYWPHMQSLFEKS